MTEQQDHEFFDLLYQQWAQTTGAKSEYWVPEEIDDDGEPGRYSIVSTDPNTNSRYEVATGLSEEDADFITGLHGALPDLIRALHDAHDEAVRKDEANDIAQGQLAEALLENQELKRQLEQFEKEAG